MKAGDHVKGWCKCGQECDCIIKEHSNKTFHAWAKCPKCGLNNAKQMRLGNSFDDLDHKLMGIKSHVLNTFNRLDREECICRIERLCEELWIESDKIK